MTYRKFEIKETQNLELGKVDNFYMMQAFVLVFIYFMMTKQYLVSFDLIIFIPFFFKNIKLLTQSPMALILIFVLILSYCGQMCMWIAWQKRMTANVNNYWTQIFINSAAWGFVCYVINSRISQKAKDYKIPVEFFFNHIKKNE